MPGFSFALDIWQKQAQQYAGHSFDHAGNTPHWWFAYVGYRTVLTEPQA